MTEPTFPPWTVDRSKPGLVYVRNANGSAVCAVYWAQPNQRPHDAEILAAAPDSLAFAIAALPILEDELECRETSGLDGYIEPVRALVEQCRAVITKAEGRA